MHLTTILKGMGVISKIKNKLARVKFNNTI